MSFILFPSIPLVGPGTITGPLTIASGTITANSPGIAISQTWNNPAVTFFGFEISITNTSSADGYPINVKVGGSSIFYVRFNGAANFIQNVSALNFISTSSAIAFGENYGVRNGSTTSVSWTSATATSGTTDLFLVRDAAATLAQRNRTNQQIFRLYNTYTDASNYERLTLTGVAGTSVNITAETLGTGADNLDIVLTPAGTGRVIFPGGAFINNNGQIIATAAGLFGAVALGYPSTDTVLYRNAAGIAEITNGTAGTWRDLKLRNLIQTAYHEVAEMTAPAAPATNSVRIYAEDNGSGKTRLMALFATGSAVQLGIEP